MSMGKYRLYSIMALGCFLLVACTKSDELTEIAQKKTAIEFNVSPGSITRAVTYSPFISGTKIPINLSSKDSGSGSITKVSTTGTTGENVADDPTASTVATSPVVYWDDIYGKYAQISVFAVAINGSGNPPSLGSDNKVNCSVAADQSSGWSAFDLLFSNNLQGTSSMIYRTSSNTFDKGKMIFRHAFARISVNIGFGTGFGASGTIEKVVFPNQYINGVLDVEAGTATGTVADVVIGKNEGSYFDAIVIPGSNHQWNAGDVFAKITVDGNEYEIRVPNNFPSTIEAGKNYNFNTTLDKSEVKVSATIADWDVVNADNASSQITFTSSLNGTNDANASKEIGNYTLYQKGTGEGTTFSKVTDAKWNETTKIWENTPAVYWPDGSSKFYYSAVSDNASIEGENAILVSGLTDYKYGTSGANAVEPTTGNVPLSFTHAMSDVVIKLTTTEDADKVELKNIKVTLVKVLKSSKISLADGTQTLDSESAGNLDLLGTGEGPSVERYGFIVPQALVRGEDKVALKIEAGGNTYVVSDMSLILATASTNTVKVPLNSKISEWLSGYKYIYTFNLKKSGISISTAVLTDWNTVDGGTTDVVF